MAASSESVEIDLILLGKTGNGKSATGNTILGIFGQENAFKDESSGSPVTQTVEVKIAHVGDKIVKVVDTPGLFDTEKTREQWIKDATEHLTLAFSHCVNGFHALVLVLKYGQQFTDEEKEIIDILKSHFGEHFVRNHCVVVVTHGEAFQLQRKRNKEQTFEKWMMNQRQGFAQLIRECQSRVVLFHNMDPDATESTRRFFELVGEIRERYTNEAFQAMQREREQLIARESVPLLKDSIERKLQLLISSHHTVKAMGMDNSEQPGKLDVLEKDALDLKKQIQEADKGTEVLASVSGYVESLLSDIKLHRDILKQTERNHDYEQRLRQAESRYDAMLQFLIAQQSQQSGTSERIKLEMLEMKERQDREARREAKERIERMAAEALEERKEIGREQERREREAREREREERERNERERKRTNCVIQ